MHKDAVVEFAWMNSLCVSGDRSGNMAIWDINSGQALRTMDNAHSGAVSKIKFFSDASQMNVILSCGQKDGCLAAHDMRTMTPIFKK